MKYIVTGGAMSTPLDDVRKIINTSTGSLSKYYVKQLIKDSEQVVYIHTDILKHDFIDIISHKVTSPKELLAVLEKEITDDSVVIHTMAVSDFKYEGSIVIEDLIQKILEKKDSDLNEEELVKIFSNCTSKDSKIKSKSDNFIYLKKDIKVIDHIKTINNNCSLISFKLLSNVSEKELIDVAMSQKERTKSDIVVANLMQNVSAKEHHGVIISNQENIKVYSKAQIVEKTLNIIRSKYE